MKKLIALFLLLALPVMAADPVPAYWWRMTSADTTNVVDWSSGSNAVYMPSVGSGPVLNTTNTSSYFYFDGVGQELRADKLDFGGLTNWMASLWVYVVANKGQCIIFNDSLGGGPGYRFGLSDQSPYFSIRTGYVQYPASVPLTEWVHLSFIFTGDTTDMSHNLLCYLNGVQLTPVFSSGSPLSVMETAEMAAAQGVVLFEKSTGIIQERKKANVIFDADNASKPATTNWIIAFQKWQPSDTTATKRRVLGAQVWKGDDPASGMDWNVYDLADYTGKKTVEPVTINELDGVIPRNCLVATDSQLGKSVMHRKYENGYFKLVKSILTLANDPRKDAVPIPKIGFDELDAILDGLYEIPATEKKANKLALKLITVNGALQRYNLLWWDSAEWHQEVE